MMIMMMINKGMLRVPDVCRLLHVSESTLYRWRRDGLGPDFVKEGRHILYNPSAIKRWVKRLSTNGYS